MNSIIIWVLVIQLNGGYCMEAPTITFTTEAACESALAGMDESHRKYSKCAPRKESK